MQLNEKLHEMIYDRKWFFIPERFCKSSDFPKVAWRWKMKNMNFMLETYFQSKFSIHLTCMLRSAETLFILKTTK